MRRIDDPSSHRRTAGPGAASCRMGACISIRRGYIIAFLRGVGESVSMTRAWPGVMARPRRRAPLASREPSVIGLVIHDLHDHDISFSTVADDRVEEPPERSQVLDVEVLQAIRVPKDARDAILSHDLTVQAVGEEDGTEGSNSSCDRRGAAGRIPFEATQALGCGSREDDIPGTKPHYRRDPLRIASARSGEASGTQTSPLLPSATIPWSPRKASAALRLGRVVEWPQRAR